MSTLKVKYNNQWQEVGATGSALAGIAENVEVLNAKVDSIHAKVDSIHVSNPNLLDNGWFTVNQRGMTSYNINGYGLDRWRTDASVAVTLGNNGVTVASSYLKQIIDSDTTKFLLGRTVTVSVLYADGVIKSGTGVVPSSIPSDSYARVCSSLGDEIILQGNRDGERLRLIIQNSTVAIRAVKLELGDTSTLAYDSAPDYATELLKCQRYFYRYASVLTGVWLTSSLIRFSVPTPVRMRSTTRVVTYSYAQFHYGGSWHDYESTTGMTLSEIQFEDCVLINVTGVSSTAYNASWAELRIGISADL